MTRFLGATLATALLFVGFGPAQADDQDAKSIVDKAIKALGGEEKLGKVNAFSWKGKGTIILGGNENDFTTEMTFKGLDHYRREIINDQFTGVTVLDGAKGWRKFGDNTTELEGDALANEKRLVYLNAIPITLVALQGNDFKCTTGGEEKVGDKPAVVLKVTGPDGKEFTLYFDKESGLPVKLVANKVLSFQGDEYTSQTTYADYKDFGGIKKATKVVVTRDGEPFQSWEITEFKVLDKVDDAKFAEPK